MTSRHIHRRSVPLVVSGIIAVLMVAVSCGGNDGFDQRQFGGPFDIAPQMRTAKMRDFGEYQNRGISVSKVAKLNKDLFKKSIKSNRAMRYGDVRQVYNYAVTTEGEIMVAVWSEDKKYPAALPTEAACETAVAGRVDATIVAEDGKMIDWFPENLTPVAVGTETTTTPTSPCWLTDLDVGLLDAISKHFMLAQGDEKAIKDFKDDWPDKTVTYAGEIWVDVAACTYSVNKNSGTYRPGEGGEIERKLAELFKQKAGVRPANVNGHPVHVDGGTKIGDCSPS